MFLTGVNVGFMPAGYYLGGQIAQLSYNWILIPLAMVIGFYIVKAEPAVLVLNKQVENISGGAISQRAMMVSLSIGMAASAGTIYDPGANRPFDSVVFNSRLRSWRWGFLLLRPRFLPPSLLTPAA